MGYGKGPGAMVTPGSVTQWCLLTRNLEIVQNLLVEKSQRKVDGKPQQKEEALQKESSMKMKHPNMK